MDAVIRQTLHVTLRKVNRSSTVIGGTDSSSADSIQSFFVTNLTVVFPEGIVAGRKPTGNTFDYTSGGGGGGARTGGTAGDKAGAGYYVLAVLLVYSMSVVALLASHIKRKHVKILEDREIHKYLREFQVVKEKSSRDSYQNLKSAVIARLSKERGQAYRNLSRSVLPLLAVSLPDRSFSSTSSGPGVWESHVGFYVGGAGGGGGGGGTHPPSALPTLRETNVDEDLDYSAAAADDDGDQTSAGSRAGSWTAGAEGGGCGGTRTQQRKQKMMMMMSTTTKMKSGSLDATSTARCSSWRNGPFKGATFKRWPPRKVQSEIMIDPVLLCPPGDGPPGPACLGAVPGASAAAAAAAAGIQRPVCIEFRGISCKAFDYSPGGADEVSPMTDDNKPETETMSLDDDVISIGASQTLPHDVSDAQNG